MMIDPGWVYEEELKGKTADEIKKWIRKVQRKINHLQKVVAEPEKYSKEWMICPDPKVQLEIYGIYLQRAREALMDAEEYFA